MSSKRTHEDNLRVPYTRLSVTIIGLIILLLITVIIALMFGSAGPIGGNSIQKMSFSTYFDIIIGKGNIYPLYQAAIVDVRLPRIILAMLVGFALSSSGTTMQALFKNPMADPYIIGISSGAAVGAATAMLMPWSFMQTPFTVPLLAFVGATATVFVVYLIARGASGRLRVETLLLSGIAVGSFLSAITAFMMYTSGKQFNNLFFWLLGGISTASWDNVMIAMFPILIGVMVLQFFTRDMNAMALGEEPAMHLGVDVETLKKILLVIVALLAGVAVAFSGIVGFVGLIIPHMVRIIVGPNHKVLLPVSTVAGGIFLIWADTIARTILPSTEIPLGIITALFGAPFFIYLLWKSGKGRG